jgi:Tfp pilus assembly protein PilN
VVLGVLAALVIAVAAYVLTSNTVSSRRAEVARATAEATATEQKAAALTPYAQFATLRQTRIATVSSLAASRFDWERVMTDLSKALPDDVWLTSLLGTVMPGVGLAAGGGAASTGSLRGAIQSPAIELVGCTVSQSEVSRVMARLRLLHGVTRVSLASSEKTDAGAATGGAASTPAAGGGGSSDCRNGSNRFPQFQVVVFFENPAGATSSAAPSPSQPVSAPGSGGGK